MRYGTVYRITNSETDKCYIGRTKNVLRVRWQQHCDPRSGCLHLKRAIEKYGKESFSIHEIASSWDIENLRELEVLLIKQENTLAPNGYNLINTNRGPGEISEETRQKLSKAGKASKGVVHTLESRKNMSEGRKGIIFSEEHCRNLSLSKKGRLSPMKGKTFSDEAKKNMSLGQKGTKKTEEYCHNMSLAIKGLLWYTDGISNCRAHDGDSVPTNFKPGRTKRLSGG